MTRLFLPSSFGAFSPWIRKKSTSGTMTAGATWVGFIGCYIRSHASIVKSAFYCAVAALCKALFNFYQ